MFDLREHRDDITEGTSEARSPEALATHGSERNSIDDADLDHDATPTSGAVLFERKELPAASGPSLDTFARDLVALRGELQARALRLTRDPAAADDLVQDSIER